MHGHVPLALFLQLALVALLPALVSAQNHLWSQCNGQNWPSTTACDAGATCVFFNDTYSQCRPDDLVNGKSSRSPSAPPTTSPTTTSHTFTLTETTIFKPETPPFSTSVGTSDPASLPTPSSDDGVSSNSTATITSTRVKPTSPEDSSSVFTSTKHASDPDQNTAPESDLPPPPSVLPSSPPPPASASATDAPASVLASSKSTTNKPAIIAGVVVPVLFLALAGAAFVLYKRRQRARDRRAWERTHAAIADAVRQVGGPVSTTNSTTWGSSTRGYVPAGGGETVTDPFVDHPVAHQQDAERPLSAYTDDASEFDESAASSVEMEYSEGPGHAQ
ncbi:hypothetical protein B0H13DRAFT_1985071 [Mycena leptocephala]|nr:hypothetical protein B0H13DRAFT_1985071 [Mycena leptocephala]